MPEIKYGTFTTTTESLPEGSVAALLSRGLTHYMGSEQAAKVSAENKRRTADGGAEMTEAEATVFKTEAQANAWQAMLDGAIGHGARGPRGSALETIMRGFALTEVTDILKANKLVMPKGDETVTLGYDAEGKPEAYTRRELIDRRLANPAHANRLRDKAEKEVKARERAAVKAMENAPEGAQGAAALGLF